MARRKAAPDPRREVLATAIELGKLEVRDGGIYLRDISVRIATFAPNTAMAQRDFKKALDAAHALLTGSPTDGR